MDTPIWFYAKSGKQAGPVTAQQLQELARTGFLSAADLVWKEGMTEWAAFGAVSELQVVPIQPQTAAPLGMISYYTPELVVEFAGFWIRFCAVFIDGILIIAAMSVPHLVVLLALGLGPGELFEPTTAQGRVVDRGSDLVAIIVGWLYEALMTSSYRQATLGKLALGIKVVDQYGQPLTFGRATGRHFAKYISHLLLLIGYIIAAFTARKQALHDLIAGTLVVKKTD